MLALVGRPGLVIGCPLSLPRAPLLEDLGDYALATDNIANSVYRHACIDLDSDRPWVTIFVDHRDPALAGAVLLHCLNHSSGDGVGMLGWRLGKTNKVVAFCDVDGRIDSKTDGVSVLYRLLLVLKIRTREQCCP